MQQRKLIRLGNSSFAIALPKPWVEKAGLKKGDIIFIEKNSNGELIIMPKFTKLSDEKIKVLDFSDVNDKKLMQREISVSYVQDSNKLEIKGLNKIKAGKIKKILGGLMGIEVIESDNDKIIAKDFFDLGEVDIENFLRRMDNDIREMLDDLEMGIKAGKLTQKQFSELYNIDNDINKFYLFVNKILFKGTNNPSVLNLLKVDVLTLFNNWWMAFNLEHMGDAVKRIARLLEQEGLRKDKIEKVHEIFLGIREAYKESINSYYKKNKQLVLKTISEKDDLITKSNSLSQDKDSTVAKMGEKFKEVVGILHQINKIIIYNL